MYPTGPPASYDKPITNRRRIVGLIYLGALAALTVLIIAGRVYFAFWINANDDSPTDPAAEVASHYANYLTKKYPARGKAKAGPCTRRQEGGSFRGAPLFICAATQDNGRDARLYVECVASTRSGVVTWADQPWPWPTGCITNNHLPPNLR